MAVAVHVGAPRRAAVVVEFVAGGRGRGSGGGKLVHDSSRSCVAQGDGSGGAGGDQGVVAVLGWLGGIPPSSLDARGRKTTEEGAAGPTGGPRPRRQVSLFYFSVCLIFPFLFFFFVIFLPCYEK